MVHFLAGICPQYLEPILSPHHHNIEIAQPQTVRAWRGAAADLNLSLLMHPAVNTERDTKSSSQEDANPEADAGLPARLV